MRLVLKLLIFSILLLNFPNLVIANTRDGLVGWWALDDSTGTNSFDSSGRGNTGTVTASPTSIIGARTNALNFNGSTQYVTVSSFTMPASGTISFWVYSNTVNWSASGCLFSKRDDLIVHSEINTGNIRLYTDGLVDIGVFASGVALQKWNHFAWSLTGSQSLFYVNGVIISTISTSNIWGASSADLRFARDGTLSRFLNGALDDIRIYNRVLTSQEIKDLYNSGIQIKGAGTNIN